MTIDPPPKGPTRREVVKTLLGAPVYVVAAQARADAGSPDEEARIERVLSGLRPPVSVEGEASAKLADQMKALHVPGVSIAVMHDGAIDWARGFGTTGKRDAKVSDVTLFQAASVSKPVTAVAALALVQAGMLALDTAVDTYLKSWKLPSSPLTRDEKVTLRRLLNHTAGTTVHGFDGYVPGAAIPNLLEILNGQAPANSPPVVVDTIPGTQFRYSGGGYTIVQQILNDVTGQPFADFLKGTVLAPSGMTHSSFDQPLPGELAAHAALPHDGKGNALAGGPHIYPELAAAGLWTTPTDLARFALALRDAWQGKPAALLSQAITQQMLTPSLGHYGLGLLVEGKPAHERFSHAGANAGYQCVMVADAAGDGAVIMTNGDNGLRLASEILRGVAGEYGWNDWPVQVRRKIVVDPKLLDGFVGNFRLNPAILIQIAKEDGHLYLQARGQDRLEIFPESSRVFFTTAVVAVITFDTDGSTPATRIIIHQGGQDMTGTRMP